VSTAEQASHEAAGGRRSPAARSAAGSRRPERRPPPLSLPPLLWLPAVAAFALVALPVVGLLLRADWPRMPELLTSDAALDALRLSLLTAAISTLLCVVLGGPLAVVLARSRLPGLRVLRSLVLLPLVLPPVVGGLALLFLLGRTGLLGRQLDIWFGITIPFTTTAVVLAQTFVALPFLVVSLEGALRTAGGRYEAIAATLGAAPGYAFRRVTVPLVLPGLASGSVLAFARCLGEFGATTAFAGSLQGTTRTLPLLVYLERESDVDGAVALSLLLVAVAVVVIAVARPRTAEGLV
jgi:molybdate transport system permease protein